MENLPALFIVALDSNQTIQVQALLLKHGYSWIDGSQAVKRYPRAIGLCVRTDSKRFGWIDTMRVRSTPSVTYTELARALQTVEELYDENESLSDQINRLTLRRTALARELDALDERIRVKRQYHAENSASIRAMLPESVTRYGKYLGSCSQCSTCDEGEEF